MNPSPDQPKPNPKPTPKPDPAPDPCPATTRAQPVRGGDAGPDSTADLARLLDGYLAELEAGRHPDRARLLADHPDLAPAIEEALAGLEFIHSAGVRESDPPIQLGDFRILRELGRGGMGVVYEAEQVSLKRRVALKVLRFTPLVDEVAQQRFQREAETVGHLHHTNIVPIFAVGSEQGVRYYAMQFIEGRDLGRIAQAARETGRPTAHREVASWGLQAAEALAHAHRRGVIHRDIKPSNLILDDEGRIWLTDFGLARRTDDVSLSRTGAVLGTPRYMSPEQAAAATRPVDHRTDIYSLGATLYELVTGRPIFEAASPHEVLSQILHQEPRAPRQVAPALPRDLETIILKCLAKEPDRRYDTAQALADDLRAFGEGRPILARRPRLPERAVRWVRRNRRATLVGSISAATALVLAAVAMAGWQAVRDARRGRVLLLSSDPSLLAEILDEQDRPVVPRTALPLAKPLSLPAGSYQLRIAAPGIPSRTWRFDLAPRENREHRVSLPPEWLWPPREAVTHPSLIEPVELRNHVDLLALLPAGRNPDGETSPARLRLLKGRDGTPAWPRDLEFSATQCPPGHDVEEWRALPGYGGVVSTFAGTGIGERARDLDVDGTRDLVLLSRSSPSLFAVSGATGQILWWHRGHPPLPASINPSGTWSSSLGQGFVVGTPTDAADLDGDGVPDFIACFRSNGETLTTPSGERIRVPGASWLGAVSGRNGTGLWTQVLDAPWAQYASSSTDATKWEAQARPRIRRVGDREAVLLVEHGQLQVRDALTGRPAGSAIDPGFALDRIPEFADLDGDGQPEALAIRRLERTTPDSMGETAFELVVLDLPAGTTRWRRDLLVVRAHQAKDVEAVVTELIAPADLDGDGRAEIVAFTQRRAESGRWAFGLTVLDGARGQVRWEHELKAGDRPQDIPGDVRWIVGPDLDGDLHRDLFAAFPDYDLDRREHGIRATAVSARNGARLWSRHQAGVGSVRSLGWWRAGADGWPALLVTCHRVSDNPETSLILEAGSGRASQVLLGITQPRAGDCDGDGIPDLMYPLTAAGGPRLAVVKGLPAESWKALEAWVAGPDADRDGRPDYYGFEASRLTARSGRGGARLWSTSHRFSSPPAVFTVLPPLPGASSPPFPASNAVPPATLLATVDVTTTTPTGERHNARSLAAFGAADGRHQWTAAGFDLGGGSRSGSMFGWSYEYPAVTSADLDQDRQPEFLAVHLDGNGPSLLSALDGRTGRVRWSTPVVDGTLVPDPQPAGLPFADFNRDGVLDLAVIQPPTGDRGAETSCRVNVLDGRDGRSCWPEPFVLTSDPRFLAWPEPALGDLDGDSVPEVAVVRHGGYQEPQGGYVCELVVLDGRTGQVRWVWSWVAGFPELWSPVFVRPAAGAPGFFCLGTIRLGATRLVAFDAAGGIRWERPVALPPNSVRLASQAWHAADLEGDGSTELVLLEDGTITVAGGPAMEVRWRWKLPAGTEALRVLPPVPAIAGQSATLVAWVGREVYGLDGVTGQPRWRGQAPTEPIWGNSGIPDLRLIQADPPPAPPALEFGSRLGSNSHTLIRNAWPTTADGRYTLPAPRR